MQIDGRIRIPGSGVATITTVNSDDRLRNVRGRLLADHWGARLYDRVSAEGRTGSRLLLGDGRTIWD